MSVRTVLVACLAIVCTTACSPNRGTFDVAPIDVPATDMSTEASADVAPCLAPMSQCGDLCVNAQTDRDNCGSCGHACPAGQSCAGGACSLTCPSPQVS
ncbi:MAG: hypothetical protein WCJ30_18260, partial [Deltaproteobacteria bacterium]